MTKGKYAARAARRHEDQDVQAEIGTYQHHVARLTAEVSTLTGKLAAERAARKQETHQLRAMLDEAVTPEVTALREELERQRDRIRKAEATAQRAQRLRDGDTDAIFRLFRDGLGLSTVETVEVMMHLNPEIADDWRNQTLVDDSLGVRRNARLTGEQARRIEASKGKRHGLDVVRLLRERMDRVLTEAAGQAR